MHAGNVVLLGAPLPRALNWEFRAHEGTVALLTAEVINLSRNVLVTGDDFTHEPCGPGAVDSTKICTYRPMSKARRLASGASPRPRLAVHLSSAYFEI